MVSAPRPVTQLLVAWTNGNRAALEELIPVVYPELRCIAARYLRRERVGHTPPPALVHEAYVKLIDQDRAQFFGVAAQLMRRILVDHASEHTAEKQDAVSSEVAPQQLPAHADYGRATGKCLLQPKDERTRGQIGEHVQRAASAGRCSCYEDSEFRAVIDGVVIALRHVLPNVPCQDFVDERLVSDTAPARFLAELLEHPRIEANRDELTWFISEGRPTHAPHNLQLLRRRIGNVRKVNLSPRTLRARGNSPASR
jgi:hypothetical protein